MLSSKRTIALAGLGAALVWLVLSHSLAAYLAEIDPDLALTLNPSHPVALIELAEARLKPKSTEPPPATRDVTASTGNVSRLSGFAIGPATDPDDKAGPDAGTGPDQPTSAEAETPAAAAKTSPEDARAARAEIRALAERALMLDPLNARALRLLAQVAEADGNAQAIPRLMEAAARRSLREAAAVHFMMRRSFEAGDYAGALDYADTILRTAPRLARFVVPLLARIAENAEARPLLEQRLAANPPWRVMVLSDLSAAVTDARTLLELLLSLRETTAPPTAADLRGYINVLIRHGYFELAYYAWLQFLPPEQLASAGLLFNGDFEHPPSGLPFDWQISSGAGTAVQATPAADIESGRALLIELGQGRIEFGHVQQLVVLAPGSYRFTGRFKGELAGRRGLVWRIACAGNQKTALAETPMITGSAPTWRPFEADFTVPDGDCRAQTVRLTHDARSASERFLSGALSIAELRIVRD